MTDHYALPFCNKTLDRITMKRLINKLVVCFGIASTTNILDQVKTLGFQQATKASISLGIDDLSAVPTRNWLVQDAEKQGYISKRHHRCGSLHAIEKLRQSIEAWYATSESSKREMNPSFKMIDPENPVHMMSFSGARGTISQVHQLLGMRGLMSDPRGQVIDLPIRRNLREGLSLTEYIISRYGARKGVVDTAVRTSDAGYLTRRLVEVVQHVAVRKKDCETAKSMSFLTSKNTEHMGIFSFRVLIGRVLADHVYWDARCVATRNQDISDKLASHLVGFSQPIYIRSPLTCRSISRICQLCYGWSLAHYDLVEVGEAVGIIAGQSIGEPGTQLTLRTFHTGGVFTGDIAEYIRIPFNGLASFDEELLYPTRTRHGHPAWLCRDDLSLFIDNYGGTHDSVIPARSLLMIRTGQYVESQQVIAEVRAKEFPPKECIRKPIYPISGGEIHWSKFLWHIRDFICNTGRLVQEASHIWILAGSTSDLVESAFLHKDQDRLSIQPFPIKRKGSQSEDHVEARVKARIGAGNCIDLRKGTHEFGTNSKYFSNWSISPRSNYILSNIKVERSEIKELVFLLLEQQKKDCIISIEAQLNQVLEESHIFTTYRNPKYQDVNLGVINYGTLRFNKQFNTRKLPLDGRMKRRSSYSCYRVARIRSFFPISKEVYLTQESPLSILIRNSNKTAIERSTRKYSETDKSSRMEKRSSEGATLIRVSSGYIYNPKRRVNSVTPGVNDLLLVPGTKIMISHEIELESWVTFEPLSSCCERKTPVLTIPVVLHHVSSDSMAQPLSRFDKPKTQRRAKAEILLFVCFKRSKPSQRVKITNHRVFELVRIRLLIEWKNYWHEKSLRQRNYLCLINVKIGNLLTTFLQVNRLMYPPKRRRISGVNKVFQGLVLLDNYSFNQVDLSNNCSESIVNHHSRTHVTLLGPTQCLLILSPFHLYRPNLLIDSSNNDCKGEILDYLHESDACKNGFFYTREKKINLSQSSKCRFVLQGYVNPHVQKGFRRVSSNLSEEKADQIGLIGTSWPIFYSSIRCYFDKYLVRKNCFSHNSKEKLGCRDSYLIDENIVLLRGLTNPFFNKNVIQDPIYRFLLAGIVSKKTMVISLGLLSGENRCLYKNCSCLQSGQVIAIQQNYLLIRTAKMILATRGTNPHKISGDIMEKGDTLITLPYDRLKSGDITQGLPKIEQLLESRSTTSIPTQIGDFFDRWYQSSTKLVGNAWSQLLSAGRSMEHCQLVLIDQIQKVYESQGVDICDKHLEIIVCQLTSRVVVSEDGVIDVFLPGELVELSQAERMNRVVRKSICYEPTLLGMTKASLSTTSFLAEASFQETTRVLAKAALRGRVDWLKGLKENVVLGDTIPVGTGSREVVCPLKVNKHKQSHLVNKGGNHWKRGARNSLINHRKSRGFTPRLVIWKQLSQFLLISRFSKKLDGDR
uniref:DNA-directed RNA polymerase subunit beta'' n=1 Tax=Antrophyum semicostatum TaxID=1604141 RepID=A0A3G5CTL7_9MONI|nr:RNA polymerase beta'' subunit [Antrophyum semicostatum]AYW16237.1 RNA polymerase beta'' subunit [Antrophyum semicostatum]